MENKYFITDLESGFKYEVTKEQYDSYNIMLQALIPKVGNIGVPLICGTKGELYNLGEEFFKQIWLNGKIQ